MSLVNYSDSDSESENQNEKPKRIKLELPAAFKNNKSNDDKEYENPELHDGRVRAIPHSRGNWISLFYINYPINESLLAAQNEIIEYCQEAKDSAKLVNFYKQTELHISLSKILNIRFHWITDIFNTIKNSFSGLKSFNLKLSRLQLFVNEEKTRSFIGILISDESIPVLTELVNKIDKCLLDYKLPTYYKPPVFHISFLWAHGDLKDQLSDQKLEELSDIFHKHFIAEEHDNFELKVTEILFKSGNKLFSVNL